MLGDKVHLNHHVGNNHSGEDLECHFDPHVDDHPAPEVGDGKVCTGSNPEPEEQEEDHDSASVQQPCGNRPHVLQCQPWAHRSVDDENPQGESNQQEDLEESAKFHEFPSLRSKPVSDFTSENSLVCKENSNQSSGSNNTAGNEQEVDEESLTWGNMGKARKEEDGVSDPAHEEPCNLEDGVIAAGNGEWNPVSKVESHGANEVGGTDDSREYLQAEQEHSKGEEGVCGTLCRTNQFSLKIRCGQDLVSSFVEWLWVNSANLSVDVQDTADTEEENNDGQKTPEHHGGGGQIASFGVMRPVVGVAVVFTWAVGSGYPSSPIQEGSEFLLIFLVDVVSEADIFGVCWVAEHPVVVDLEVFEGVDLGLVDLNGTVHGSAAVVAAVGAFLAVPVEVQFALHTNADTVEITRALTSIESLHGQDHLMEGISGEVWATLRTITPEGSVVHETTLKEDLLSVLYVIQGDDCLSAVVHEVAHWWSFIVGGLSELQDTKEADDRHKEEVSDPVVLVQQNLINCSHDCLRVKSECFPTCVKNKGEKWHSHSSRKT